MVQVSPAEGNKDAVKTRDEYSTVLADIQKLGAVIQNDALNKFNEIKASIEQSGKIIATSALVNLIVNKLTPLPVSKSRAAFIREYEYSIKGLDFDADQAAKSWLTDLQKQAAVQEKTKPRPKMSPKRRSSQIVIESIEPIIIFNL